VVVVERVGASALLAANDVDGAAVDDHEDPGVRGCALGAITRRAAPDGEERLLYGILGQRPVAQDSQREGVGAPAVEVVEPGEPMLASGGGLCDERDRVGLARACNPDLEQRARHMEV
jgi:hypothetical protein